MEIAIAIFFLAIFGGAAILAFGILLFKRRKKK
jgi:LPXTG-motif cell wall-anchored protein